MGLAQEKPASLRRATPGSGRSEDHAAHVHGSSYLLRRLMQREYYSVPRAWRFVALGAVWYNQHACYSLRQGGATKCGRHANREIRLLYG